MLTLSTGVSTFASRTSPSTDQSLQKSFHLSHPRTKKNYFLKFPSLLKFLKPLTTANTNRPNLNLTTTPKLTIYKDFTTTTDRRPAYNRVARPTQNYVGRGSHTTVHADLAYGGSWCKRVAHESLFRTDFLVVVEHGFITALG